MTQHTSGPWHTAGDQGVQIRSEKHQIAKVWCMRGKEFKANAQLIAAAPELLEALEKMLDQFDSEIYSEYGGTSMLDDRLAEANHARKAVAKARGEHHG